jgi:MSHA pilin protein MshC
MCHHEHAGRAAGFTLIELVTAIVIIAILAAVVAPHFFDTRAFSERGYADEVASALRYTQKIAIASDCGAEVTINGGSYTALQQAACNAGPWTTPIRRTDGEALAGTPPGDAVVAPDATIVFARDGNVVGVPPVLAVGAFTVTVGSPSGLVTVQP